MDEHMLEKPKYEPIHPMTKKTIAFLESIGPLTHADIIAITSDLKAFANIKVYENKVV